MKKYIYFICLLIFLTSCSSDDSNLAFIVGKWKVTQRIVDGEVIELSECDEVRVIEFKSDFTMKSYLDAQVTGSVVCGIHEFLYKWGKISDSHFVSNHISINTLTINYYKENNRLKVVYYDGNEDYYTRTP